MKPVVIDVTRLVSRLASGRLPTGVDRVSLAYVAHYRARARALFRYRQFHGLFSAEVSQQLFDLLHHWPVRAGIRRQIELLAWRGVMSCIGRGNARGQLMFNTGHSGLELPNAGKVIEWHNVRPLFVVHDLIPVRYPEFCRPGDADKHDRRLKNMLRLGAGLIAISASTLAELRAYADERGLSLPPASVAPLAPAIPFDGPVGPRPLDADTPYFVVLGTIEPRKNHLMLLHAWQRMILTDPARTPHLVVIGQPGWESENVEDLLQRSRVLQGHITVLRQCTDVALRAWMHHARALLFPSFAEGFGMPIVEALAAGLPVIASDLPVLREVAGDVPDFLDPIDALGWIRMVEDYAEPGSLRRQRQLERMRLYRPPTWADHFARVDAFIDSLADRPISVPSREERIGRGV